MNSLVVIVEDEFVDEFDKYIDTIDNMATWYKINEILESKLEDAKENVEVANQVCIPRLDKNHPFLRHPISEEDAYEYNEKRWLQMMDCMIANSNPYIMNMWAAGLGAPPESTTFKVLRARHVNVNMNVNERCLKKMSRPLSRKASSTFLESQFTLI
jgi:hypothetical protein